MSTSAVTLRWPQRSSRSTIHCGVFACVFTLRMMRPEKRPHRSGAFTWTLSFASCFGWTGGKLLVEKSYTDAKLKVSDSIAIPEFVELYIPNKDETYRAKVQWRTGFEIGVTFENDQEAPSIVPGAAPADLPERVRRLEAEVASLHRKLNELQNELRHGQGSGI